MASVRVIVAFVALGALLAAGLAMTADGPLYRGITAPAEPLGDEPTRLPAAEEPFLPGAVPPAMRPAAPAARWIPADSLVERNATNQTAANGTMAPVGHGEPEEPPLVLNGGGKCLPDMPESYRKLLFNGKPADRLHVETIRQYGSDASKREARLEVCAIPVDTMLRRVVLIGSVEAARADIDADVLAKAQEILGNGGEGNLTDVAATDQSTSTQIIREVYTPLDDEAAVRLILSPPEERRGYR